MSKHRWMLLLCVGLALNGCVMQYAMRPDAGTGQTVAYDKGAPAVLSQKLNIVVVGPVASTLTTKEPPKFVVTVTNGSDTNFDFDTPNVKATVNSKPHKVWETDELVAEVRSKMAAAAFLTALGGAMQSYSAGQSAGRYRSSGYVSGYNSSGNYVSGNYTAYGYDQAAASRASADVNAQTAAQMDRIGAAGRAQTDVIDRTGLRRKTLGKGESVTGVVTLDKIDSQAKEITLRVEAGSDVHDFTFKIDEIKR